MTIETADVTNAPDGSPRHAASPRNGQTLIEAILARRSRDTADGVVARVESEVVAAVARGEQFPPLTVLAFDSSDPYGMGRIPASGIDTLDVVVVAGLDLDQYAHSHAALAFARSIDASAVIHVTHTSRPNEPREVVVALEDVGTGRLVRIACISIDEEGRACLGSFETVHSRYVSEPLAPWNEGRLDHE